MKNLKRKKKISPSNLTQNYENFVSAMSYIFLHLLITEKGSHQRKAAHFPLQKRHVILVLLHITCVNLDRVIQGWKKPFIDLHLTMIEHVDTSLVLLMFITASKRKKKRPGSSISHSYTLSAQYSLEIMTRVIYMPITLFLDTEISSQ